MTKPILEVEDLSISFDSYEGKANVLNNVNFSVDRGETLALVGETGCGKSLTTKAILGLLPGADITGNIYYKGENILTQSEDARHALRGNQMGIIMQDPMTSLNPVFTIGEHMRDLILYQGNADFSFQKYIYDKIFLSDRKNWRERAIAVLRDVQIPSPERVLSSYPTQLSGGMRQRVLIAMALLSDPEFLIADEPGTALDVTTEKKILNILESIVKRDNKSIIYITHDLGVAKEISDTIAVMYAGQIAEIGTSERIFELPAHPYTRGLIDSVPSLSRGIGKGIKGNIPDYVTVDSACRFADRCPHAEPECRRVTPDTRQIIENHSVNCHLYPHPESNTEQPYIGPPSWFKKQEVNK